MLFKGEIKRIKAIPYVRTGCSLFYSREATVLCASGTCSGRTETKLDQIPPPLWAGFKRRGFIHHTTVKKEYREQGIEKKLVDSALAALEAEGIHKVALVAFEKRKNWVVKVVESDTIYINRRLTT